jgi:hypothetical protein
MKSLAANLSDQALDQELRQADLEIAKHELEVLRLKQSIHPVHMRRIVLQSEKRRRQARGASCKARCGWCDQPNCQHGAQ